MIFEEILKFYQKQIPFVSYRKSESAELHFIAQFDAKLHRFKSYNTSSFIFAPFDEGGEIYQILPQLYLKEALKPKETILDSGIDFKLTENHEEQHINLVSKAIATIQETKLRKVVVARKESTIVKDLDILSLFKNLLNKYSNTFTYILYHPSVGLWMGATPETLISVKDLSFKTMALAGTMEYKEEKIPQWGAKELEEQKMVQDFIKSQLKRKVKDLEFSEVTTHKAGKLLHLKTEITGKLNSNRSIKKLVKLLHPTPAVCGLPKKESKNFIRKNEHFHRKLYTGYLGEVNINGITDLKVNLRCMEYLNSKLSIYVGGGITADSDPRKEWQETVAKTSTIKEAF